VVENHLIGQDSKGEFANPLKHKIVGNDHMLALPIKHAMEGNHRMLPFFIFHFFISRKWKS